jgi:hypothetical protein
MHPVARTCLRVVAAAYLLGLWQEGIGCSIPGKVVPKSLDYFLQIAALFPDAAKSASQFRAEGWICKEQKWQELYTEPYFPLNPYNKENRFQRVIHFYPDARGPAMHALDQYLVDRHNAGNTDDNIPRDERIGGIRIVSINVPIPKPGSHVERYRWRPLDEYPKNERHKGPYRTAPHKIEERCGPSGTPAAAPAPAESDSAWESSDAGAAPSEALEPQ